MHKILIWASAADPKVLAQCPGETVRYEAMGAAILTTASIASVSAAFAASMALGLPTVVTVVVGLCWGIAILNIDRLLVGGIHRRDTVKGNVLVAIPRVVLALLIGAVVSAPLVLQIFAGEINAQLDLDRRAALADFTKKLDNDPRYFQIPALTAKVQQLQQTVDGVPTADVSNDPDVAHLQTQYDQLNSQYLRAEHNVVCENEGTCGSARVGKGPAYDEKVKIRNRLAAQLADKKTELDNARTTASAAQAASGKKIQTHAETDLKTAKDDLTAMIAGRKADLADYTGNATDDRGLLARLEALDHLRSRNATLGTAYLTLMALLAALEMLPVLAKLMMSLGDPSTYEKIRVNTEEADFAIAANAALFRMEVAALTSQSAAATEIQQTTENDQHVADAQQRVFNAVLEKWTHRELGKVEAHLDDYLINPEPADDQAPENQAPENQQEPPVNQPQQPLVNQYQQQSAIYVPQQSPPETP
jgi:hypothetical protein